MLAANQGRVSLFASAAMRSDVDLIKTGTNDPDVAINWHRHLVPSIEKKIQEQKEFVELLRARMPSDVQENERALRELEVAFAAFLAQWPKPERIELVDQVDESMDIHELLGKASFVQSFPGVPLTYASVDGWMLLAKDDSGRLYKAPNVWYNQPYERVRQVWSW